MANLQRKQDAADQMFSSLVREMHDSMNINIEPYRGDKETIPTWL